MRPWPRLQFVLPEAVGAVVCLRREDSSYRCGGFKRDTMRVQKIFLSYYCARLRLASTQAPSVL